MSHLITPTKKLHEFPILNRFVTHFILEYMSEVAPAYSHVFEHVFMPKMYVKLETEVCDPIDIDFEIVAGDYDIYSCPCAKELLEDKRDTSDEEAWALAHKFSKTAKNTLCKQSSLKMNNKAIKNVSIARKKKG